MSASSRSNQESTRERILAAALPLFAAHGFAGTSTRMIAKAASVNVATLAYYFEGKEGLYLTVLERLYQELLSFLPGELPALGPETITWLATQSWSFCRQHRDHIRLVLRHVLDQGHHEDVVVGQWTEPIIARIEAILRTFRPDWTPVRARMYLFAAMHMMVRFSIEDPDQMRTMMGGVQDIDAEVIAFLEDFLRAHLIAPSA